MVPWWSLFREKALALEADADLERGTSELIVLWGCEKRMPIHFSVTVPKLNAFFSHTIGRSMVIDVAPL